MLVFGGLGRISPEEETLCDGAAYEVDSETWDIFEAPPGFCRAHHTAVWTGEEMIVWGGTGGGVSLAIGAAYDPASGRWRLLPEAPLPTGGRSSAAWTGDELVVVLYPDDGTVASGAAYDPSDNTWRELPASPLAGLFGSSTLWTGSEVLTLSHWPEMVTPRLWPSASYSVGEDAWRPIRSRHPMGRRRSPSSGRERSES